MRKEAKVRAVTIAVIAAAALVAIGARTNWRLPDSGGNLISTTSQAELRPQDILYRMLDAAGEGDTAAYLDCYQGPLRRRLEQTRDEMTPDAFGRYLARTNAQIKGIAISEPEAVAETEVEVRVEFVYPDRNETQQFFLEKTINGWKIVRVSAAQRVETLVPYGTPVY